MSKELQNNDNNSKLINLVNSINLLLSSNDKFNELLSKATITLSSSQSNSIKNTLNYLNASVNDKYPLKIILDEVDLVLADNKVELYEIPRLVNQTHECLKDLQSVTISTGDIGILIKIILLILIDAKLLELTSNDYNTIIGLLDMSVILLNKSVDIKLPKFKLCCF